MTDTTLLLQGSVSSIPDLGLAINENGTLNVVLTNDRDGERMIRVLSQSEVATLLQFLQPLQQNA